MSELEKIADHDERSRKDAHAYYVALISGCPIVCYRPGLALVDFYRLNHVLASAEQPKTQVPTKPKDTCSKKGESV